MGTTIKHPVADLVKPSFVIFEIYSVSQKKSPPEGS